MKMSTNQTAAFNAGVEFAKFLNDSPNERQNWSQLSRDDGIPEGDYAELTREFGECNSDMEDQFRAGFNKTLCE
jgi:hypothetical protein